MNGEFIEIPIFPKKKKRFRPHLKKSLLLWLVQSWLWTENLPMR